MLFSSTSPLQTQPVVWDYSRNKKTKPKNKKEERKRRKKKKEEEEEEVKEVRLKLGQGGVNLIRQVLIYASTMLKTFQTALSHITTFFIYIASDAFNQTSFNICQEHVKTF